MTDVDTPRNDPMGELRPSYRTLNEPTRLIGLSLQAWAALIVASGAGYAFLGISPLPWRLNFSVVVIVLGAPVMLLVLREPGTIGPGRLLAGVFGWRLRTARVLSPTPERPARRGAVRLDATLEAIDSEESVSELPWTGSSDSNGAVR